MLLRWTGNRWMITLSKEMGQKTFSENQAEIQKKLLDEEKMSDINKKFKNAFPDAELLEVKKDN